MTIVLKCIFATPTIFCCRVRGYGLITFSDGTHGRPRNEGRFEDNKCVERCKAQDAVRKSKQSAANAKAIVQQLN